MGVTRVTKRPYNFKRKSEEKHMVSFWGTNISMATLTPTNLLRLPSFDGRCLLSICRPLHRAVEVGDTIWAAVSAPHGGKPTIQARDAACLLSLGHFHKVSLQNKLMSNGILLTFQNCRYHIVLLCKEFCIDESSWKVSVSPCLGRFFWGVP